MSAVTIRRAEPADGPFLREMLYHSIYVPEGAEPPDRSVVETPEITRYVEGWGRSGDVGLIASDQSSGERIGAVWARLFPEDAPGYGFVDARTPELGIAVLPGHRGRGVGGELLLALFAEASECPALSLSVSADNPARRLYQRMGFEPVEERDGSVIMRKNLGEGSA